MGILIKRPVRVKVIVTDAFRAHRTAEIRAALARLDSVGRRIDAQLARRRSTGADAESAASRVAMERLEGAKRSNEQARAQLASELESVSALELASEYDRGTLEGLVEANVGDDIASFSACEIVVRDNKVVEIREG